MNRWRTVFGALALALGAAAPAHAQSTVRVDQAPTMSGNAYIGETLTASGGHWSGPPGTSASWMWLRCTSDSPNTVVGRSSMSSLWNSCTILNTRGSSRYTLTNADANRFIRLVLYAEWRRDRQYQYDFLATAPSSRVRTAPPPPPPPPPPAPTPEPTPVPTPDPAFEVPVAAPTPVPTTGQVLHKSQSGRRVMKPFPVVRMRGRLTFTGARITVLSVRAPKKAKVKVTCRGDCPRSRWSANERKRKLTRVRAFERSIRAGTRITVTVTRRGFIGKRTVFLIRRGKVPLRADRCINRRGKTTRCPGSA